MELCVFKTLISNKFFSLEKSGTQDAHGYFYRLVEPDSVVILPFDSMGNVYLVEQFRPAVGKRTLEFPAGAIIRGEAPSVAASRECLEETGMKCCSFVAVSGELYCLPNRVKSNLYVYVALVENAGLGINLVETSLKICERQVLVMKISSGLFRHAAGLGGLYLANNFFGFDVLSASTKKLVDSLKAEGDTL